MWLCGPFVLGDPTMKKKHLLCLILGLLLSLAAPVYASGSQNSTRIEALCTLPDISVVVPSTAEVFINPYRLPVTVESDETTAQIVSAPACIENRSEVPVSVTVSVTGAVKEGSDLGLVSYPTEGVGTRKRAFVYFEMLASATENLPQSAWSGGYDAEKHLVVRAGVTKSKKNVVILSAADGAEPFGAFRLSGDCVVAPRGGWSEGDGLDVEIAFTFKPLARPGI